LAAVTLLSAFPAMATDVAAEPAALDEFAAADDGGEVVVEDGGGPLDALQPQIFLRAGLWSHSRDFTDPGAVSVAGFVMRAAPRLSDRLDAYAEARAQTDSTGRGDADLEEAWARFAAGPARLIVGRQIVAWGRADRYNPTDVIGARDYTRLLASDDEQRRGALIAQATYGAGPWTFSALWLPEFRPNRFPVDRSRPGVVVLDDQKVEDRSQFAARIDHSGGALDWSISYFEGRSRTRDIALVPVPAGVAVLAAVQQQFPETSVVGADLAGVAGRFGYRAEAAYTEVGGAPTPFRTKDNFWIVVGVDRTFDSGWNVNLQYSFRYVFDYEDPAQLSNPVVRVIALQSATVNNQLDRRQNGMTLRFARSWRNERLEFETSAAGYFETRDIAIRPRLSYALNDSTRAVLGADVFLGPQLSYFGRVRDLSAAYAQIVYGF
jgi:hypothetical protein